MGFSQDYISAIIDFLSSGGSPFRGIGSVVLKFQDGTSVSLPPNLSLPDDYTIRLDQQYTNDGDSTVTITSIEVWQKEDQNTGEKMLIASFDVNWSVEPGQTISIPITLSYSKNGIGKYIVQYTLGNLDGVTRSPDLYLISGESATKLNASVDVDAQNLVVTFTVTRTSQGETGSLVYRITEQDSGLGYAYIISENFCFCDGITYSLQFKITLSVA